MIITLESVCFNKIWGGDKLQKNYNYPVSNSCGECWGISAHKSASSMITNTKYKGLTLRELFHQEKSLFGHYEGTEFPILVKVIDASQNLSIQVHPDNEYAKQFDSLGKEECWYVLDTEDNTDIIIGHTLDTKEAFKKAIEEGELEKYCQQFPIKKGDFFYIEAGTLHAICKGTTLLEVQQSSDITYRVYDYNRLENGKARDLHVKEALDVVSIPSNPLLKTHQDTFFHYDIIKNTTLKQEQAHLHGDYIFIIDGEGSFDKTPVRKGDFLMVPSLSSYTVFGNVTYQKTQF